MFYHFGVVRIGLPMRPIIGFSPPWCIEISERSALCGHLYRGAVGFQCEGLLYLHGESRRFGRTVMESQCCEHVAFGRDAQSRTTSLRAICGSFFQSSSSTRRMSSSSGSAAILLMINSIFSNSVDDVVHHTHRLLDVLLEFLEVERRFFGERFVHVTQQVDRQQAA